MEQGSFSRIEREEIAADLIELGRQLVSDRAISKLILEAERFRDCGAKVRAYGCPLCSHNYRVPLSCNSRICDKCGVRVWKRLRRRFLSAIAPFWERRSRSFSPKFLTLTFTSDRWSERGFPDRGDMVRAQAEVRLFITKHYHKFQAKRSRNGGYYLTKQWRGCGAICVPELGKSGNLHFHCLVYGPVISQKALSLSWAEITTDSIVVDIREAKKPDKAVKYILKYVAKPPALAGSRSIAAWALIIKGLRRISTYGILYGSVSTKKEPSGIPFVCIFDGSALFFRGEVEDPGGDLIDWLKYSSSMDPPAGRFAVDYNAFLGSPRSADKIFFDNREEVN